MAFNSSTWRGDRQQATTALAISLRRHYIRTCTAGWTPSHRENLIFILSQRSPLKSLPLYTKNPGSGRTEKLPVLLWTSSTIPPSKTHSFCWLNQPHRSQHSTKECPLLFTQINRYTHWQKPTGTSVLVWICVTWWWTLIPYCSNLKPPGNGKGSTYKKRS